MKRRIFTAMAVLAFSAFGMNAQTLQSTTWKAYGISFKVNPEKPDVPLNKNDAFQKVQKRRVQEKR